MGYRRSFALRAAAAIGVAGRSRHVGARDDEGAETGRTLLAAALWLIMGGLGLGELLRYITVISCPSVLQEMAVVAVVAVEMGRMAKSGRSASDLDMCFFGLKVPGCCHFQFAKAHTDAIGGRLNLGWRIGWRIKSRSLLV